MKKAPERHKVSSKKPRAESASVAPSAMRWNPYAANCPTRLVLDRIADKWAMLVLALLAKGPVRFNRLRATIEGVSQKVLSQTLKRLERDGLVDRRAFPTVPVTVEYSITPLGLTLAATADALTQWAETNIEAVLEAHKRFDGR